MVMASKTGQPTLGPYIDPERSNLLVRIVVRPIGRVALHGLAWESLLLRPKTAALKALGVA